MQAASSLRTTSIICRLSHPPCLTPSTPFSSDMSRRRIIKETASASTRSDGAEYPTSKAGDRALVATSLIDYALMVSLVFGGCCSNVWAYEQLLRMESGIGPALTFSQMLFISLQQLPNFFDWRAMRLKPRQVPLIQWALQVLVFASGSLLNNLVYAYAVPLTVQIVFRSAAMITGVYRIGLAVSMLFGRLILGKSYSATQVVAVSLVSLGVILSTLSRPTKPSSSMPGPDVARYTIGVSMLTASLVLTGILGMLQERTYKRYGPCWREGVFYTHALSLPMFLFMVPQVKHGLHSLAHYSPQAPSSSANAVTPYLILGANLASQLVCVAGVNQLSSRVSSVSTQVVLTTRKALSLCFSVWWFGNGWNAQLAVGAGMVFAGSCWYSLSPAPMSASVREGSSGTTNAPKGKKVL
ncbi:UAA transporter family-domain-containing protein [Amylostereum chailletii]|nr:UAA transporter family-domain-containing protein [Amylostereum chailletii]